ncbi:MAG: WG repeat-containing protein [Flavobacteriaceae bacterium]|nr:WG repeat-containing protein [Flavobacteriaceae bacterium]
MRILTYILIIISLISCSKQKINTQNKELENFLSVLDSLTIDEVKVELKKNITLAENFINLFNDFSSIKIKTYKEENYEAIFNIDTTNIDKALKQFGVLGFNQNYKNDITKLKFSFRNNTHQRKIDLGEGIKELFTPKKIFYKKGEVKTENIKDNIVGFHFSYDWGKRAIIDSVVIDYEISYTNTYKTMTLSLKNPTATHNGGTLELIKLEKNYAYLKISDTISNFLKIQAFNDAGKALSRKSYSSSNGIPIEGNENKIQEILKYGEKIQEKLINNKFTTIEALKNQIRSDLANSEFFDTDGFLYLEGYYEGNISEIKLYFGEKTTTKKTQFKAVNNVKTQHILEVDLENGTMFIDSLGKELFTTHNKSIMHLTSNYYECMDYYYHFNSSIKTLDTLFVYNLDSYKNGLVTIQQDSKEDDFAFFDSENKQLSAYKYWFIKVVSGQLFGKYEKGYFKIDSLGKETPLPNIINIYDAKEEMIGLKNIDYKLGFMDNKGKMVTPIIYNSIESFSDGVAFVKKDTDNYGCIDKKGKMVLPFKYKKVYKFIQGITAVKYDGSYKLINKKGEVLIESEAPSIIISTNLGKRIYNLNGKKYNTKAQLIVEDQ